MEEKDIRLYGVLSHSIDRVWFEIEPLLEKAIKYSDGKYEVEDVYRAIKSKDMQLWVIYDNRGIRGCCITQIIKFPRKKVLFLVFIAGFEFHEWVHFGNEMKRFAKEKGCDSLEGYGRAGWEKIIKSLGFKKVHTVFKFDIK